MNSEFWRRREERKRQEMMGMGNRSYREKDYRDYRSDYNRNPYGSEGGYVDHNYKRDYRSNDYAGYDSRDYNMGRDYRDYSNGQHSMRDERYDQYSGSDYHYEQQEYKQELHKWKNKLESKKRFMQPEEEVIKRAKDMGIQFGQFTEDEFYVAYLLMQSMFTGISNDFNIYVSMAKDFLMEKDIKVSPSDKLSIYLCHIVNGEY